MSILQNASNPKGLGGRIMLGKMNGGAHAKLAQWGFAFVDATADADVLDIGCGGGANVARWLDRCPKGRVTGIDYSPASVAKTKQVNAREIMRGRCDVLEGDVSALPFDDNSFDVVSAFETVYFWPGLERSFAEVFRVMKPKGSFLICNETDGTNPVAQKWTEKIDGMVIYDENDLRRALGAVGFEIADAEHADTDWMCVIAVKP